MQHKSNSILIIMGIAAVISVAAGIFIVMNPWYLTTTQQAIIGVLSIISGVLFAGFSKRSWAGVFSLILFGLYQLGRASGIIEHSFFRFIVGIPLIGLGLFAIYKIVEIIFPDEKEM